MTSIVGSYPYGYSNFTQVTDVSGLIDSKTPTKIGNYSGRITIEVDDVANNSQISFDMDGGYGNYFSNQKNFYLVDDTVSGLYNNPTYPNVIKPNYVKFSVTATNLVYAFTFSPYPAVQHTISVTNPAGETVTNGRFIIAVSVKRLAH